MPQQPEPALVEGEYYPRIARSWKDDKLADSPGWNPEERERAKSHAKSDELANSEAQLHYLKEHLEHICQVIYPCKENQSAFGNEIRNILILACTEVEGQWKSILKANGMVRDRYDTNQYVKLLPAMRLDEYSVRFPYYPKMDDIWPFQGWRDYDPAQPGLPGPTESLKWYAAYNRVKHDREENFKEASLLRTFEAITGFFVIMCAQHGWAFVEREKEAETKFFFLKERPNWEEKYQYKPEANSKMTFKSKPYPFF
jgi:hypothetical protein